MKYSNFLQFDSMDCGPACLMMICSYHGKHVDMNELRELCSLSKQGTSLKGLSSAASSLGFKNIAVKITFEELIKDAPLPCVLHWNQNHFVTLFKVKKKFGKYYFIIGDPAFGLSEIKQDQFLKNWISSNYTGVALLFEKNSEFQKSSSAINKDSEMNYFKDYLKSFKKSILLILISLTFSTCISLAIPFLMTQLIDNAIQYKNISLLKIILLSQLIIFVSSFLNELYRSKILLLMNNKISLSILSDFLVKLFKLPINFFDTKSVGDLTQRISDHNRIQTFLTGTSLNTFFSLINLVIYSAILVFYDLNIFMISIILLSVNISWTFYFVKKKKSIDYLNFQKSAQNNNLVYELISNIKEIKSQNIDKVKRWQWEQNQMELNSLRIKVFNIDQKEKAGTSLILHLGSLITTYYCAMSVISNELTIGGLITISYLLGQLKAPAEQTVTFFSSAQYARLSFKRLNEIYSIKDEDEDKNIAVQTSEFQSNKDRDKVGIQLKNINFKYENSEKYLFKNLNLSIPFGKTTAIVGASGSGKSTLLKIILRYYNVETGSILYNGININEIPVSIWRDECGILMQEGHIFSDTIKDNISLYDEFVSDEKINYALKSSNIYDFVEELALKSDTKIGQNELAISNGQKQRILIARVIYKDPNIVILDEATSSLDSINEMQIMENLVKIFKNKTVIIVAHRLSTVKNADQIIVLNNGEVVEIGNHKALILNNSYYYKLVKNQLELVN